MQAKSTHWSQNYGDFVIRWRWVIAIASVALALLAASGARFLTVDNDYRVFFGKDNPQLQAFEQIQRTYTKVDNILFALEPKDGDMFSPQMLALTEELTHRAWQIPFALRVDSISNFQYTYSEEDDLIVQDLVEGGDSLNPGERNGRKLVALSEPTLLGQLINDNASVTGINVTFQMPQKSLDEVPQAVNYARTLAAELEQKYEVKVHLAGMVMLNNAFFESSMQDMGTLVPAMYLAIIIITFLLVRSKSATLATLLVILLSMITAMGLAGFAGVGLTPPSSAATTIIMTLAVADSIHVLVSMFTAMREGKSRHEAIKESLRLNIGPIFLTSITTAIGFLAMNFAEAPPFHDLGNITAVGVMAALVFSLTLLPALMAIFPAKARQAGSGFEKQMQSLGDFVIGKRKPLMWISFLVSIVLLSFIPQNRLEDAWVQYFDESVPFRQDSDFVSDRLSGLYQIQYSLDSGENNGVANPEFLSKLDGFVSWMRQQPEVKNVTSISDTFKRLNKNMHGDDPAWYRLPDNKELAAQYLLLYELSLPYGLDLNNQLNISKSSTQVIVTAKDMTSEGIRELAERGTRWLKDNANIDAEGAGSAVMFSHIAERNIDSMLGGTLAALVLISGLIMVALKSLRIGVLSLVPNLLPAGLAFGLWGLLVGEVNMAVSMVAGMTLGIVVDDTVHFLSKYLRARREQGLDAEQAVRYAFKSVGVAIVTTSIILCAGFMILAQSNFGLNSSMALLTAIGIGAALLADFFLLPALLILLDKKTRQTQIVKEHAYA